MPPTGRWYMLGIVIAMVTLAGLFGPRRAGAEAPRVELAPDRHAIEEGGRMFVHYCGPCHGDSGHGDGRFFASSLEPPPPDFTAPQFRNSRADRQLADAIKGGSASIGKSDLCPPWGRTFPSGDIEYLIAYIRQLQRKQE